MDQNKNNKRFLKCFLVCIAIVILICLTYVSGTLAQWTTYSNAGWFSQPFFSSPFLSFSPISNYGGSFNNSFYPPNVSSFSPGLSSFQGLSYRNPYEGIYAGLTNYNNYSNGTSYDFPTVPNFSSILNPYIGLLSPGSWFTPYPLLDIPPIPPPNFPYVQPYSPVVNVTPYNRWTWTSIIPAPQPEVEASNAPGKMNGKWESQESTEEGNLKIDRGSDKILAMEDSSLPLGEGSLTEFDYTPKFNKAPISFKAEFDSGYTAKFTGTADNQLPPPGVLPAYYSKDVHNFKVEGDYVVKDDSGQVADRGTFSIIGYMY